MTGYTVHTGTSKKFVSGWDRVFTGPADAESSDAAAKKSDNSKKKAKKSGKNRKKKS